jgi:hypothetical protein
MFALARYVHVKQFPFLEIRATLRLCAGYCQTRFEHVYSNIANMVSLRPSTYQIVE